MLKREIQLIATGTLLLILVGCGSDQILTSEQEPDPVVVDVPIAFIKRVIPLDEDLEIIPQNLGKPNSFVGGAGLYIKSRASASAEETNVSDSAFFSPEEIAQASPEKLLAPYDVKDLSLSYDGNRLIFAMRAPEIEGVDDDEQPTWNLWQYDVQEDELNRIISSDIQAEAGQDIAPAYLPDGRIVFSSTRQDANQAILLDEGKPQYQGLEENRDEPASVLHVIEQDGSDIQQISFNQSHDLDPSVLSSGKILFSRWDQAGNNDTINLYRMNTDGSELEIVYGRHSHQSERSNRPLQFSQAVEMPNGRILAALREFENVQWGGDYSSIDIENFIDNQQPIASQTGLAGPAQIAALFENIIIDGSVSPGGYFSAVSPLWDTSERVLFSWSQCRVYDPEQPVPEPEQTEDTRTIMPCSEDLLANEAIEAAPLLYGLWIFDPIDNTQLPVAIPQEGLMYTEVMAMQGRPFAGNAQMPEEFDADLADKNLGMVHIRSIYDFAGADTSPQGIAALSDPTQTPVDDRPIRFLRVVKAVSIPDEDVRDFSNVAFGRDRNQSLREIIGYVPVEPDGSVFFQVPANVPLAFSLLDENGMRVGQRHQNWLQFAPGEVRQCNGCHTQASQLPHGRLDAEATSINQGAAATGVPFPNTNPVLFADLGETMAQTTGRINGVQYPSADIRFSDIWSDPTIQTPSADFTYAYGDLNSALPITASCATDWTDLCRIQHSFPAHIQPIFDLPRQIFAEDGITLLEDRTCVSCHTNIGADELLQVPVAQLDLRGVPSNENAEQFIAYRELMFNDAEQEFLEGAIVDRLVEVTDGNGDTVFELDEDGELILDAEGNPIPVLQTINVGNSMSNNGALSSSRFFQNFDQNGAHSAWLTPAEIKLLAEWLDIGGQYYNNPFDAPLD
jgi:hypothetical protein